MYSDPGYIGIHCELRSKPHLFFRDISGTKRRWNFKFAHNISLNRLQLCAIADLQNLEWILENLSTVYIIGFLE